MSLSLLKPFLLVQCSYVSKRDFRDARGCFVDGLEFKFVLEDKSGVGKLGGACRVHSAFI